MEEMTVFDFIKKELIKIEKDCLDSDGNLPVYDSFELIELINNIEDKWKKYEWDK